MNSNALTFATVAQLVQQTAPYRLVAKGNTLAPQIMHGDMVEITPLCDSHLGVAIEPGTFVLIAVAQDAEAVSMHRFLSRGLYRLNGDGDAIGNGVVIDGGSFQVLGIAAPLPGCHDTPSEAYRKVLDPRD